MVTTIAGLDRVRMADIPAMTDLSRTATASDPVPSVLVSNQLAPADLAYHLCTDHAYPDSPDLVVRHGDRVVAWVGLSKPTNWLKPGVHRLMGPFVDPAFQGRGLGRGLLAAAVAYARQHRLQGCLEAVLPENRLASIALLEEAGFKQVTRVFLLERPAGSPFHWSRGGIAHDFDVAECRPVTDDAELADIIARGYAGAWEKYETTPKAIVVLRSDPRFDPRAVLLARQQGRAIALSRCDLDSPAMGPQRRAHWWTIAVDPAHRGNLGLLLAMGRRMFNYLDQQGIAGVQTGYAEGRFFLGQAYRLAGFKDTNMTLHFYRLPLEA